MFIYQMKREKKLDDKSSRCVFLGFSEESKANRMYDPKPKKKLSSAVMLFLKREKNGIGDQLVKKLWSLILNGKMKKMKFKKMWK